MQFRSILVFVNSVLVRGVFIALVVVVVERVCQATVLPSQVDIVPHSLVPTTDIEYLSLF